MLLRVCGFCLACLFAHGAVASCSNVSLITQRPLEFGTLRPMYNAEGFVQLDPVEGLSFSNGDSTHNARFGEGRLTVMGLVGTTVTIGVDILNNNEEATRLGADLSEVIVRHGVEETRITPPEGVFRVTLPQRGTMEGLAKTAVRLGAVMRYNAPRRSETVHYKLVLSCLETAYAF